MKEERNMKAKLFLENDIVAKINEDIKEKRKIDEKMSLLAKKRKNALNDKEHKLFKRVDCHPSNLFDSGEINVDSLNLKKRETSDLIVDNSKKKKKQNNFSYAKKIRQFREFISSKKELIDEMMAIEKKFDEKEEEEKKKKNDGDDKKNYKNIDMSLFFKLASINYDMYNKFVKEQNKQNTKDPEIKILGFDEYLNENQKE